MGDAEIPVEDTLTSGIDAEILKVGHHGSTSSSSLAFLNKVAPEVAIICAGTSNTYGHPHQETLTKLQSIGATIYRTDLNGSVVVTTDGNTYSVTTSKTIHTTTDITPASTQATQSKSSGIYVGNIMSDKYHLHSCRYAQKIAPENRI